MVHHSVNNSKSEKRDGVSNESSDTDKTSGSLFRSHGSATRHEELPNKFEDLLTIDEFYALTTSGNSGESLYEASLRDGSSSKTRSHRKTANSISKEQETKLNKSQSLRDKEAIAEMDRQYDHNLCLDRFINDMEKQNNNNQRKIESAQQESQDENRNIPSRMIPSSHLESCSNCSRESSGLCRWCNLGSGTSGSSSAHPQSNETESNNSNISESVKSSTPENVVTDKPTDETNGQNLKTFNSIANMDANKDPVQNEVQNEMQDSKEANNDDTNKPKKYKGGKLGRKRKREYIYNPKPVKEKRSKETVPEQCKDNYYWEKRLRNNEAARKSRELRRKKELETQNRYHCLRKENEALRLAIALLVKRNERIDFILAEYAKSENKDSFIIPADGLPPAMEQQFFKN